MAFGDTAKKKKTLGGFGVTTATTLPKSSGGFGIQKTTTTSTNDIEPLLNLAKENNLTKQAEQITAPPNLSALQRLSKGLGAFNPAEAILTGTEKGLGQGVAKYVTGVGKGIASAVTGTDYEGQRRQFAEVAEKLGVENSIAKFGIGLAGDILLDPSTYFGSALVRGIGKGIGVAGKTASGVLSKVAPNVDDAIKGTATALKSAGGRAFVYGFGSSKGATDDIARHMSRVDRAKLGLAASNLNRLGTGLLTKSQQEELALALIKGKRAEFAAREAGEAFSSEAVKSADPLVQKTIGAQLARSKKFGEQLGLENPYEVYFPFIRTDKVKNFVTSTKNIKIGSEGYLKQFRNLLTNENLEKSPAKAFFTREAQIATDRMTRDFLNGFVRKHGKELGAFKTLDAAKKAGFDVIKEKGMFGKEIGYLPKGDVALIRDALSPEFQTIDMVAKATGFDAMTSLFKRAVTGLFPSFHVRNYVSGVIQNYEVLGPAALNPKTMAAGQKIAYLMASGKKPPAGILNVAGKPTKFSKVFNAFTERFGNDTFYQQEFLDAVASGKTMQHVVPILSKETLKTTLKTGGLGSQAIHFKAARVVGQFIEHQQKATAYLAALSQGKSIDAALKLAERAGFDYRALTRFESQILRRLIPFYSFTRKNIELQLRTLGENPQRINQVISLLENAQGDISPEEKAQLPDYAKEQFILKTGERKPGYPEIAAGLGTPIEALSSVFGTEKTVGGVRRPATADSIRRISASLNPLIKVPLERAFNKDFFRDRPLNEVVEASEYQNAPQFIKDFLSAREVKRIDKEGNEVTKVKVDPYALQLLRSLPTTRGATYLNSIFSEDTSNLSKLLSAVTGIKPRPVDLETIEYFRERDKKRALEDLLVRFGVLKRFEKTYEPK